MYPTRKIAIEFDKLEKKQAHVLKKNKLVIPFVLEKFTLQYGLTRYDMNTGILSVPYLIETKRSEDLIEERFFKRYFDIITAETLDEQQLIRKRKMQLELSQEISIENKNGILNTMLKKRILFPFAFRRYWMKWTLDHFDMKWLQADNTLGVETPAQVLARQKMDSTPVTPSMIDQDIPKITPKDLETKTPVLQIQGVLHVSIPHYFRDLIRFKFATILHSGEIVKATRPNNQYLIKYDYRLPNLFVRFNQEKIREEAIKFMQLELEGLERYKNFLHWNLKSMYGKVFTNSIIEWADDFSIKIILPLTRIQKYFQKATARIVPAIALASTIDLISRNKTKKKKKPKKK
jgi:hypothetical protein